MTIQNCPLDSDWQSWDLFGRRFTHLSDPEDVETYNRACEAKCGEELRYIAATWHTASDDVSQQPPAEGGNFSPGTPEHVHAEFKIDDDLIHIDRVHIARSGPGRSFTEVRIYINAKFAGRAGKGGSSLGGGGSSLPAAALIGDDKVLTSDGEGISLWERL